MQKKEWIEKQEERIRERYKSEDSFESGREHFSVRPRVDHKNGHRREKKKRKWNVQEEKPNIHCINLSQE